ncbi:hypothetical protein [Oceanivirga salmonicida]|uniref:hypothetical protein n=1 Tax=Oceanivirga salmonicida TaxID=1769291 RepID=UPI0012E21644|nr:hypothetical protein [Oceanivirga salmonicida]
MIKKEIDMLIKQTKITINEIQKDEDYNNDKVLKEYHRDYEKVLKILLDGDIPKIEWGLKMVSHICVRGYLETCSDWSKPCLREIGKLHEMIHEILEKMRNM